LYSVGRTGEPVALAFLAPPVDYGNNYTPNRIKAASLISWLTEELSSFAQGRITRYSDDFEPRAFGDNFQKNGASVILMESGTWLNDPDKQYLRKLNFTGILTSLSALADGKTISCQTGNYDNLASNEKIFFDYLFRNLTLIINNKKFLCDIGVNLKEYSHSDYIIEELGDLALFFGRKEIDCSSKEYIPDKDQLRPGKDARNILKELL
jgi:hypothetical protein